MNSSHRAFSLVELLIALSVLAIVVALIAPQFLNIQQQSNDAVAAAIASQLNHTYAEWQASGGRTGGSPFTSDLLLTLTDSTGQVVTRGSDVSLVQDSTDSARIRLGSTGDLPSVLANVNSSNPSMVVPYQGLFITFDQAKQQFMILPADTLSGSNWASIASQTRSYLSGTPIAGWAYTDHGVPVSFSFSPVWLSTGSIPSAVSSGVAGSMSGNTLTLYGYSDRWLKFTAKKVGSSFGSMNVAMDISAVN